MRSWTAPAIGALLTGLGVYAVATASDGASRAFGAVAVLAGALYAATMSRRRLAYVSATEAAAPAEQGRVVAYVRPGCVFCNRLIRATRSVRDQIVWVDIWSDDEAAAFVRSVNQGNETVPTVVISGHAQTNPDPSRVLAAL